jgi:hypothetical protein
MSKNNVKIDRLSVLLIKINQTDYPDNLEIEVGTYKYTQKIYK